MSRLLSAVVTLTPAGTGSIPTAMGRAVHAWFLERVGEQDQALAKHLHNDEGPRPFSISNLWGTGSARGGRVSIDPRQPCWLRLTALTDEVSVALEAALPAPGAQIVLDDTPFIVREVATETAQHPWAGRTTYADLAQEYTLASSERPQGVTLRFSSPTLFRSQGQDVPLPLPALVFGSYLRKWNAFAPLALPDEARRYAEECVALGRFKLRSHFVSFEHGGKGGNVGFTGEVRFRFLVGDGYWTRVMTLLAGYAFWAGTGYRTTAGLGQTQAVRRPAGG